MIKSFWSRLDPKKQRIVAVLIGAAVLVGIVSIFSTPPENGKSATHANGRQDVIRNILTDKDTKSVGIDSLSAKLKIVDKDNEAINRELKKINEQLKLNKESTDKASDINREVVRLRQEITNLNKKIGEVEANAKKEVAKNRENPNETKSETSETFVNNPSDSVSKNENPLFEKRTHSTNPSPNKGPDGKPTERPRLQITSYSQRVEQTESESDSATDDSLYLPAGSIITGTLINGMDAPTGQGARRDPFPSTMRIQEEAILPNRFRADIRECFLIIGGYGDLSSERAYLRGETLSCVREDGGVIEATLPSYAVGEDGKAGVRGRLVDKQGQVIAKSLVAGFMGGAAEAFDVNAVPTINTSTNGQTQYQEVMSPQLMQGAAVQGASKALDRIAQFYINMADGIFPVIEVDAGRQIDIIVTKGTKLALKSKGEKARK